MGIFTGWNYLFHQTPLPRVGATASRSALDQFQTYPDNKMQGSGVFVSQDGGFTPGKYWNVTQPPQVFADHTGTVENLIAGGTLAGGFTSPSLIDNPNATVGLS